MENADISPPPEAKKRKSRKGINWEAIEDAYRAGVLSIRAIADINSITDKAIRNKAKALGWERDLTDKVNGKVRNELIRSENPTAHTEREIVEAAAATVVHVVREHRIKIKQGGELVELLTKQLLDVAGKRDEFEAAIAAECADDEKPERYRRLMQAVSLEKHAQIAGNLATATKTWVGLERQAFGLAGDESPAPQEANKADVAQRVELDFSAVRAKREQIQA